jgi:aspartyl-tRNA(Asn)/glutamyl-tRNA(Gln) amidotransferase subunit A
MRMQTSLKELGQRFRDGSLSPESFALTCLAAIEERNPALGCFFHVTEAIALAEARQATADFAAGIDRGPLQGIPYAVADVIDVAGVPTTCGSRLMVDHIPDTNSHIVEQLRKAGAVLLGKLSVFEFAVGSPGLDSLFSPARNPCDVSRSPGASAAGAAVAAGLLPFAVVPDTGGAARGSAALCGVVGLKPSFGLISCDGIFPVAASLDHCGIVGSSAADVATVMHTVIPYRQKSATADRPSSKPVTGLTIGVAAATADTQAVMQSAVQHAASKFQAHGASIKSIAIDYFDRLFAAGQIVYAVECLAVHREALKHQPDQFARNTRSRIIVGAFLSADDYAKAKRLANSLSQRFDDEVMSGCDIFLCPASGGPAPLIEASPYGVSGRSGVQTLPYNITGHPAISVPCGESAGLPLGLQMVGQRNGEIDLLLAAQSFAAMTPHSQRTGT